MGQSQPVITVSPWAIANQLLPTPRDGPSIKAGTSNAIMEIVTPTMTRRRQLSQIVMHKEPQPPSIGNGSPNRHAGCTFITAVLFRHRSIIRARWLGVGGAAI
jgi:hypothetical protein